jgi:hypothetical protein
LSSLINVFDPLGNNEKNHTLKLLRKNQISNDTIPWKQIIQCLKYQFNKLYTKNKVREIWNSRRKRQNNSRQKSISKIKQEHQKFIFPLPSSISSHLYTPYSQNDPSSRVPIESLLSETHFFPDSSQIKQIMKEYFVICNV